MPVLFVGYALLSWFLVARCRRRPMCVVWLALSVAGLFGINWVHGQLPIWLNDPGFKLTSVRAMMYPYTALVGGIGLYIAVLPRRTDDHCRYCGYDLASLLGEFGVVRCPECGKDHRRDGRGTHRSGTVTARRRAEPDASTPAEQNGRPRRQHKKRKARDQAEPHEPQRIFW